MSVYIEPRGKSWHVKWRPRGETRKVHLGALSTEHRAIMRREAAKDLLARGIAPSLERLEPKAPERRARLGAVAQAWVDSKVSWSDSTRSVREGYVRSIVGWFEPARDPGSIGVDDVRSWVAAMIREELQGTTIRSRMVALRCILDEAGVHPNPARDRRVELPKAKARVRALPTEKQLELVRDALSPQDRRIFAILEHGGLRLDEAIRLQWEQVDNARDRLIDVGFKGKTTRVVERLGFQPDWIPVRAPDTFGRIFQGDGDQFYARLRRACEAAGVARVNPHLMRHLHASRLEAWRGQKHELGLAAMAERMGHSQQQFLLTYNHRMPHN